MNSILASIHSHPSYWLLGAYYIFSNAVGALPTPAATGTFYRFFFDFSHAIAGNISRIVATRYPQQADSGSVTKQ
jgi:hypothetical protein